MRAAKTASKQENKMIRKFHMIRKYMIFWVIVDKMYNKFTYFAVKLEAEAESAAWTAQASNHVKKKKTMRVIRRRTLIFNNNRFSAQNYIYFFFRLFFSFALRIFALWNYLLCSITLNFWNLTKKKLNDLSLYKKTERENLLFFCLFTFRTESYFDVLIFFLIHTDNTAE